MGKTIRKFSKKGKKTQYKRKTKGKKPIHRKSVRRNKFRGGDASQQIKTKVDEAVRLVYKKPETNANLNQAKNILEELSKPGQPSCSTLSRFEKAKSKMGFGKDNKDQACEKAKTKEYIKALMLLQKISTEEEDSDLSDKFFEKSNNRPGESMSDEEKMVVLASMGEEVDKELHKEEIYAFMNDEPDYYLDEENDNGLHRIIIDVFEGKKKGIKSHKVVLEGNEKQVLEGWIRQADVQDRNVATFTEGDLKETYDEVKAKFLNENPGVLKENPSDRWGRDNQQGYAEIKNAFANMNQKNRSP
jgi:hypothetical protein